MLSNCTDLCKVYGKKIFSHEGEEAFYTNFASINDSEMKRAMAVPSAILTALLLDGSWKASEQGRSRLG